MDLEQVNQGHDQRAYLGGLYIKGCYMDSSTKGDKSKGNINKYKRGHQA